LWGHKPLAIPVSAVTRVNAGIWLNIAKQQVKGLRAWTSDIRIVRRAPQMGRDPPGRTPPLPGRRSGLVPSAGWKVTAT